MKTLVTTAKETPAFVIDGSHIGSWPDLVAAINAFIPQSDWRGNSLDALDDILYGGYGTPDRFVVVWQASETSRARLGYEATKAHFKNVPNFDQLYEAGHLTTLFSSVVNIFRSHANIELRWNRHGTDKLAGIYQALSRSGSSLCRLRN